MHFFIRPGRQVPTTQQWINRVVRNAPFGAAYFGAAVLPFAVAALAFAAHRRRRAAAWLAIGAVYVGGVFWLTRSINIPINDAVAGWNAASPPADWAALRERWNEANLLRTVAAGLAFAGAVVMRGCRLR